MRLAHSTGIGRRGLEDMGVTVRSDQGDNPYVVAANLPDHVTEDGKRRHDGYGLVRPCRR